MWILRIPVFRSRAKNPYLFPGAALHIGLAFHELIINSESYGALVSEDEEVKITFSIVRADSQDASVRVCWEETFPDGDCEEQDWKLRSAVPCLSGSCPCQSTGQATYEIECGKVAYRLTMPALQFDI